MNKIWKFDLPYIADKALFAATMWVLKLIREECVDPAGAIERSSLRYGVNAVEVERLVGIAATQDMARRARVSACKRSSARARQAGAAQSDNPEDLIAI